MQPIYQKTFHIPASAVEAADRLKLSQILDYLQDVAGDHSAMLGTDRQSLTEKNLFWAVIRHRVQITRLPRAGEDITVETWPMPTTRTAYPRSTIAYDADGKECFRAISLWVLMDSQSRAMVLPGKSGVDVAGLLRGCELAVPGSLAVRPMENRLSRTVRYTDLDWNGHMNNCRYLDWVTDTLPGDFHRRNPAREFSVCYLSEARELETLDLSFEIDADRCLCVAACRQQEDVSAGHNRVFAAKVQY